MRQESFGVSCSTLPIAGRLCTGRPAFGFRQRMGNNKESFHVRQLGSEDLGTGA
jgi:hypothetical protein